MPRRRKALLNSSVWVEILTAGRKPWGWGPGWQRWKEEDSAQGEKELLKWDLWRLLTTAALAPLPRPHLNEEFSLGPGQLLDQGDRCQSSRGNSLSVTLCGGSWIIKTVSCALAHLLFIATWERQLCLKYFFRWGKWGPQKGIDLPKLTQQETWQAWNLSPSLLGAKLMSSN